MKKKYVTIIAVAILLIIVLAVTFCFTTESGESTGEPLSPVSETARPQLGKYDFPEGRIEPIAYWEHFPYKNSLSSAYILKDTVTNVHYMLIMHASSMSMTITPLYDYDDSVLK